MKNHCYEHLGKSTYKDKTQNQLLSKQNHITAIT